MQNIEASIVPLKIAELVEVVARKKQMSTKDALCYFYNSEFYSKLYDSKAKWWYLPVEELYIELEKTKKQEKIDFTSRELLFVIFCIERYSIKQGKSPLEVYSLFERKEVTDYLKGNFDILHTQGEEYILEEIELYLKKRRNS